MILIREYNSLGVIVDASEVLIFYIQCRAACDQEQCKWRQALKAEPSVTTSQCSGAGGDLFKPQSLSPCLSVRLSPWQPPPCCHCSLFVPRYFRANASSDVIQDTAKNEVVISGSGTDSARETHCCSAYNVAVRKRTTAKYQLMKLKLNTSQPLHFLLTSSQPSPKLKQLNIWFNTN